MTILCLPISWGLFKMGFPPPYLFYTMIAICFIRPHCPIINSQKKNYPDFRVTDYFLKNILPAIVTFSITYSCILYFHLLIHNVMLRLFVVSIASPILTMLIAYFINTSHEERRFIYRYITKKR